MFEILSTSGATANLDPMTTETVKWIFGLGIPGAIFGALWRIWDSLSTKIDSLEKVVQEESKQLLEKAQQEDSKIWDAVEAVNTSLKSHDHNDTQIHLKFTEQIAGLANRDDLRRGLDSMADRIITSRSQTPRRPT